MEIVTHVIDTDQTKKDVTNFLKSKNLSGKVYTFKELLAERNSKIKQKTKKLTEEMFSTEFDTPLNGFKNEASLKTCLFIKTEEDILGVLKNNYEWLELS